MIEKLSYGGWSNCYRVTDGRVELIVTTDVGPRVIRYGFTGGRNFFWENPWQLGKSDEAYWQIRGGHRLWVAPELLLVTYALDNGPIEARIISDNSIALLQRAPLQKEMIISLDGGFVEVIHTIRNCGDEIAELSPWAVTVMAQEGLAIAAFPRRGSNNGSFLPANPLVMWDYTDFSDPRWAFTSQYLLLRHDPSISRPQKAGLFNEQTFAAYLIGGDLFVKQSRAQRGVKYPDFFCSLEIFANNDFLELETLGPLVRLQPDEAATHVEHWSLHRNISLESLTSRELDRVLLPLMK